MLSYNVMGCLPMGIFPTEVFMIKKCVEKKQLKHSNLDVCRNFRAFPLLKWKKKLLDFI